MTRGGAERGAPRSRHRSWSVATTCSRSPSGRLTQAAARPTGQLLFVAGEAGIGKTRLLGSIGRRAERARASPSCAAAAFPGDARGLRRRAARPGRRPAPQPATAGAAGRRGAGRPACASPAPTRRRPAPAAPAAGAGPGRRARRRSTPVGRCWSCWRTCTGPTELSLEVVGHLAARLRRPRAARGRRLPQRRAVPGHADARLADPAAVPAAGRGGPAAPADGRRRPRR